MILRRLRLESFKKPLAFGRGSGVGKGAWFEGELGGHRSRCNLLFNSVLADFVEKSFVADFEEAGRFLAIPSCLLQGAADRLDLGLVFHTPNQ